MFYNCNEEIKRQSPTNDQELAHANWQDLYEGQGQVRPTAMLAYNLTQTMWDESLGDREGQNWSANLLVRYRVPS
ncbi:MAG: hypothetical protein BWX66_00087 [Deltaproteobacteria bacterium ADurb.Bin058]|jgi:hypothetical protein|nr:MAG: hypothetical protein BWX66_00087 [Deltaproteobacteria bacterium ADurb.Bin058]